jgi:hypothetical protein
LADSNLCELRGKKLTCTRRQQGKDAGNYITKLPKAEHGVQEWQAAMEALILVATLGGPIMFARIGVMRALRRVRFIREVFFNKRVQATLYHFLQNVL